jgi:8-oxo-dGTP pyrophosphatase MutT (NUDIX family)
MFVTELFTLMENDDDHARALEQTGYWGAQAAGSIFLARATKRFLIAHRSRAVEQPGTWGTWGGAIDSGENPEEGARREAMEEAGHAGHLTMIPLYVFKDKNFRYSNFLAVVDKEFAPELNWETQGYEWCEFGQWPQPLHFGLQALLKDRRSIATIRKVLAQLG